MFINPGLMRFITVMTCQNLVTKCLHHFWQFGKYSQVLGIKRKMKHLKMKKARIDE